MLETNGCYGLSFRSYECCECRRKGWQRLYSYLPNLDDLPSNVNSSYHTLQDLSTLDTSDSDLSLLHLNVRSLSLHVDELVSTLATLKINCDVIGVSETWNSFENPIKTNVEIPGYSYFPCQSHSQNGGVALYVKSGLNLLPRPDLSKESTDFESVWVEVEYKNGKNYLFCCSYYCYYYYCPFFTPFCCLAAFSGQRIESLNLRCPESF